MQANPLIVYCIAWSAAGPAKVGIAENVVARLASLQNAHPYRLEIHSAIVVESQDKAALIERNVLKTLKDDRLIGEWINIKPAALSAVIRSTAKTAGGFVAWQATAKQTENRAKQLNDSRKLKEIARARLAIQDAVDNDICIRYSPFPKA